MGDKPPPYTGGSLQWLVITYGDKPPPYTGLLRRYMVITYAVSDSLPRLGTDLPIHEAPGA